MTRVVWVLAAPLIAVAALRATARSLHAIEIVRDAVEDLYAATGGSR